jgi:hypothetical protein
VLPSKETITGDDSIHGDRQKEQTVQKLSPPAWLDGVEGTSRSTEKAEETGADSQEDGQAASAFVEQGLHSAASEMETNRKSPRSASAIFGRFDRRCIVRIISCRRVSGNDYRFNPSVLPTICDGFGSRVENGGHSRRRRSKCFILGRIRERRSP